MDYEAIRSTIEFAADGHLVSRLNCGNSTMEATKQARSFALGMAKAFELAGLLTDEEVSKIMSGI